MSESMNSTKMLFAAIAVAAAGPAFGHGDKPHTAKAEDRVISAEDKAFGREGDPKRVTRTIRIDMSDKMRFSPGTLEVKRGEIVAFEVRNGGNAMHEMVLGTMKELQEHAELMRKHPGMEHDEPYMAHVAPGKSERIVWHFNKPGEFYYGCLIPGHFEAGMVGRVIVR
jgi:uncharacterized cupredoxin-like copper-binding protein